MKKSSVVTKPENLIQPDIPSTWRAMEALYDSGKVRAIGVSNLSTKKLGDLLEIARVPPPVDQVECPPSWDQRKLRAFWVFTFGSPGTVTLKSEVLKHPVLNIVAEKLEDLPHRLLFAGACKWVIACFPRASRFFSSLPRSIPLSSWLLVIVDWQDLTQKAAIPMRPSAPTRQLRNFGMVRSDRTI
ncbi:NADPH-dependent aldo-keto reductase, chloroplastic [Vitis vinifera]|uniref:NADPH-dependent aldo-keto reductase, chloroplastic n=1 Tax=Vitis vinifera TaxID=29760 RepID=A0A438HSK8_VITVI|nr:NADPH-dependent aldo-keto reductase, chloroplastic [Vitis vinifera]